MSPEDTQLSYKPTILHTDKIILSTVIKRLA